MDIIFKGRHTEVPERFRRHASTKLSKIEKLDHRAIRVDVEVSTERNPRQADRKERVELTIRSRGPVIRAEAAADDRYAALDRAMAKLETRLRKSCERRKYRRGTQIPHRVRGLWARAAGGLGAAITAGRPAPTRPEGGTPAGAAAGPAATGSAAAGERGGDVVPIEMEGDGPVVVREKFHAAAPMTVDQALAEMELVGHDFYLFRDEGCGHPSVVYRRHGYQYGLIRLVEEAGAQAGDGSGAWP